MLKIVQCITLKKLVILSLILKVTMFCFIGSWNNGGIADDSSMSYEHYAQNILKHHSFIPVQPISINNLKPDDRWKYISFQYDTYRMPGYPIFLAIVYLFGGINPWAAIAVQILISLISVILVYKIAIQLTLNESIAKIATLLFCIDIHSIFIANLLYSDTLFVLLFLTSLYYFFDGYKRKKVMQIAISSLFMVFASFTRPVSLMFPVILIAILFFFNKGAIKWGIKASAIFGVLYLTLIGGWVLRNHNVYDRWKISSTGGFNLLMYYAMSTESQITGKAPEAIKIAFQKQADSLGFMKMNNVFDQSDLYTKIGWDYIKVHKMQYLKTNVEGWIHMMLSLGNPDLVRMMGWEDCKGSEIVSLKLSNIANNFSTKTKAATGIFIAFVLLLQYLGAVCGLCFLLVRKNYLVLFFVLATIAYYLVITGPIGTYRYKLPIVFIICIVSGYGYYNLLNKRLESQAK